ncbi:MAG: acetylxylan esterase [Glaciihabitans sp.]|nr:acetylxylan esterase [Glaciihabitans sp.]
MALFDLPLEELRDYRPEIARPADLDDFWASTLQTALTFPLDVTVEPVDNGLSVVDTFDVSFAGYGGDRIRAWLHLPVGADGPLPTVVQYHGYSGGRGAVHQFIEYAIAGYAHLSVDTRGQGWTGENATDDPSQSSGTVAVPGVMTRGILDPANYYYRRAYTDAVRAIDAARTLAQVDSDRVVVAGASQGGGIALAAGALAEGLAGVMPDVPFLCHFNRSIEIVDSFPYGEIAGYLRQYRSREATVRATLAYFDNAVLSERATAPTLFSVALMDQVCPPSSVFAAFNAYGTAGGASPDRQIEVYPFNGHEGGAEEHQARKYAWLRSLFAG